MSSQQSTPDLGQVVQDAVRHIGRYDGRGKANKTRVIKPSGRKPAFAKHLTRNTAAVVLKDKNCKELWSELLDHKDPKFRFEVLRYLTDRLEGRAFTAVNPQEQAKQQSLQQDNRLQLAIGTLNISGSGKVGKKAKKPAELQAISGELAGNVAQEPGEAQSPSEQEAQATISHCVSE